MLISDISEMSESYNLKGYTVTFDIEEGLDSLCHSFVLVCLKNYGYRNEFIKMGWNVIWMLTVLHY